MEEIDAKYTHLCDWPSDINEHLPTLRRLARQCDTVAEFGVRGIVSTWALLKGLAEGPEPAAEQLQAPANDAADSAAAAVAAGGQGPPKRLLCVDIDPIPGIDAVAAAAECVGVSLSFQQGDSAKVELAEDVDLLFIDTWHVYGHLKRELSAHHSRVRKFIAMHDTTVDAEQGETVRMGWDAEAQARESGYPVDEIVRGLQSALDEFLAAHAGEWEVAERHTHNNGLTVLRRRGQAAGAQQAPA